MRAQGSMLEAVPEFVVTTGVSVVGDSIVGQGRGETSAFVEYDSHTGSTVPTSNYTSDIKKGRQSDVRKAALLTTESGTSGARPSIPVKAPDLEAAEKGTSTARSGKATEAKSTKRSASPPCSREHSLKSVLPEMPIALQAVVGIKSTQRDTASSLCCVGLDADGDESKRGFRTCSRAWWRFAVHSFYTEIKKVVELVRAKPLLLVPGLVVLGTLLGLGLWALMSASSSEERFRHESANKIAADKALYIQTELDKTFMPAYVFSATVQQNPNYYPPQPPDLNKTYSNPWYLVNKNFDKLAKDLIALTKAGSVRTLSAIPHGVIRTMYPLNGTTPDDDRNWRAIGKNWLNDFANAAPVKLSLTSHNLTIIGPYNLVQGGIGIVGMQAIFVNASQNDTFDIPPGPDGATGPTSSIPGMLDLVWQPTKPEAKRFWGLGTVLISWDALRDNVTNLQDLETQGYDYVLTRPDANGTELAVDWSSGVDPPRPPDFNPAAGKRPLIYHNLHETLSDPVVVPVILPNVEWTLYITRTGGWVPSWKAPLVAMIVVLSIVLSALVFAVLVSRVQQRRLFRDVVAAAGQLANTTRTLEEEKNRMQALLARHYDLIDLLEGGISGSGMNAATGVAPGGAGGPGAGGGGEADGCTRSRIDMLRHKMLLSGSSLRREQLGESEQVTIQELLGEGTFGKVYKGLWRGTEVAIKTIVLPAKMSGKEKREKMAVMEAAISSSLAHPNIVQTYTYQIRPLRDSSQMVPSPVSVATGGNSAAAGGLGTEGTGPSSTTGTEDNQRGAPLVGLANGVSTLRRTVDLADQGAIVVGSPDSSRSGVAASTANHSTSAEVAAIAAAAAVASPAAAVGAGGAGVPGNSPPPTPTAVEATAASATAGNRAAATVGVPRGGTMEGPSNGVHSYEVQLVLEFCDRGCLRDALDAGAFFAQGGLNYPAILETAADIAKAMLHLHLNDVLHSDLKATNIMLKSAGAGSGRGVIAKVADFGLSVRLDHTATHVSHTFQGSLTHMAPEVMLQGHISRPADVYAFGITMWEIFTGGHPYRGTPGALLGHQTSKEGRRPVFPLGTPAAYRELAERCWRAEASQRPTFSEILDLLTKMRTELGGSTPPLQPFAPLHKKMAEALAEQQQLQLQQPFNANAGAAGLGDHGYDCFNGLDGGGKANGLNGLLNGLNGSGTYSGGPSAGGSGSSGLGVGGGGSGVHSGYFGAGAALHKITGPAAIQVGSRVLTLSQAMQSADASQGRASGLGIVITSASASASGLNGSTLMGFPGILETIHEEGCGQYGTSGVEGGGGEYGTTTGGTSSLTTGGADSTGDGEEDGDGAGVGGRVGSSGGGGGNAPGTGRGGPGSGIGRFRGFLVEAQRAAAGAATTSGLSSGGASPNGGAKA